MKYSSLNKLNQPLDFRSQFTYSGVKTDDFEEDYEPTNQHLLQRTMATRIISLILTTLSYIVCCASFPFSAYFTIKLVNQYERIVTYRLGHVQKPKGPGFVVVLPCVDKWTKVDLRTKAFNIPPTNLCTSDGCIISVGACVHFRIRNPLQMSLSSQNVNHAVRDAARSSMSNLLSKRSFHDIKSKKAVEEHSIQVDVNQFARDWGVEISRVELSDVTLIVAPEEKQSAFMPMYGADPSPSSNAALNTLGQLAEFGKHFVMQSLQSREPEIVQDISNSTAQSFKTAEDLFEVVKSSINPGLVSEVNATYQFNITGGGDYYLDLKNGSGFASRGRIPNNEADVDVTVSPENLHKLLSGELTPYTAYSSGRLNLEGDLSKAMLLDKVLESVKL